MNTNAKVKRFVSIDIALIASTHYSFQSFWLSKFNYIAIKIYAILNGFFSQWNKIKYSTKKDTTISFYVFVLLQLLGSQWKSITIGKWQSINIARRSVSTGNFKNACCLITLFTFALFVCFHRFAPFRVRKKNAHPLFFADSCLYAFSLFHFVGISRKHSLLFTAEKLIEFP